MKIVIVMFLFMILAVSGFMVLAQSGLVPMPSPGAGSWATEFGLAPDDEVLGELDEQDADGWSVEYVDLDAMRKSRGIKVPSPKPRRG